MSTQPPDARLYFILARNAPTGVIFRRGPSRWVQIIKWDTRHDRFEFGQWFHGRIYELRSDISPDGTRMIYFAQKITARTLRDTEYTYAWTAVSKPPYLTALALWPKGDCWHGGGLFTTDKSVWLNHRPEAAHPHRDHTPPRALEVTPNPQAYGEDWPVFCRRMQRDGWVLRQNMEAHRLPRFQGYATTKPEIWTKKHPSRPVTLYMKGSIEGPDLTRVHEFSVKCEDGRRVDIGRADCADWDQRGRLVYAAGGRIFAAGIDGDTAQSKELANLNDLKPENVSAPGWARRWSDR